MSHLNPWGVSRMPGSTSTLLGKIVLQQVHVPTSALKQAGLNLTRVSKVTFTPAAGADGTTTAGAYLSDLGPRDLSAKSPVRSYYEYAFAHSPAQGGDRGRFRDHGVASPGRF